MSGTTWNTSVTELVLLFRDVLRAITEPLERAHIPWNTPDAYDQWDAIAQALWEQIVIDAINYAINEGSVVLAVPKYGMGYPTYAELSFIEARPMNTLSTERLTLVDLVNDEPTFAKAWVAHLSEDANRVRLGPIDVDTTQFVFCHRQPDGSFIEWTDLAID